MRGPEPAKSRARERVRRRAAAESTGWQRELGVEELLGSAPWERNGTGFSLRSGAVRHWPPRMARARRGLGAGSGSPLSSACRKSCWMLISALLAWANAIKPPEPAQLRRRVSLGGSQRPNALAHTRVCMLDAAVCDAILVDAAAPSTESALRRLRAPSTLSQHSNTTHCGRGGAFLANSPYAGVVVGLGTWALTRKPHATCTPLNRVVPRPSSQALNTYTIKSRIFAHVDTNYFIAPLEPCGTLIALDCLLPISSRLNGLLPPTSQPDID